MHSICHTLKLEWSDWSPYFVLLYTLDQDITEHVNERVRKTERKKELSMVDGQEDKLNTCLL